MGSALVGNFGILRSIAPVQNTGRKSCKQIEERGYDLR